MSQTEDTSHSTVSWLFQICVLLLVNLKLADSKLTSTYKVNETALHYPYFTGKLSIPEGKTLAIQCSSITAITILGAKFARTSTSINLGETPTTYKTYLRDRLPQNVTCPESNMMNYVASVCGRERTSSCAIQAIDPLPYTEANSVCRPRTLTVDFECKK